MRAVSFVENIEFDFAGPVLRNGLALGDVDNDGNDELVVGNEDGDLCIFKGAECWQTINSLGFISCLAIGDVLNIKENCLVVISADGWCHIYYISKKKATKQANLEADFPSLYSQNDSSEDETKQLLSTEENGFLELIHKQRIPANSKVAILGDIDNDGYIELVLGLTDRVVRSYRWVDVPSINDGTSSISSKVIRGKLVGLNKWECANQIGSVTLHHSSDGSPCLLVAQPGGTFMRIKCQTEGAYGPITENFDASESNSIRSDSFAASFVDYQFLGLSRMRNQNISTEILGDLNVVNESESTQNKGKPYAVATLDGTIMLVQDEIILWAIQVDHQTFALSKLDVTGNGYDDIIVCSWDGQTYILDQEKNSVRFQLDEPVQAFCTGNYSLALGQKPSPCLVYVTFWNKIFLYYDVHIKSMIIKKFVPDFTKLEGPEPLLEKLNPTEEETTNRKTKRDLVEFLLYGVEN